MLAAAALKIGDDVAGIAPHWANLEAGDHAARFRPRPSRVGKGLEPAQFLTKGACVARCRRCLQSRDVLRQTAVLRQPEDIAQPDPVTQVQNSGVQ